MPGLPAHQVAYVGDKYETDARDAGLRAYWLDRAATGTALPDGVTVIRSLEGSAAALIGQLVTEIQRRVPVSDVRFPSW
jgi:putative hydrolase of the HAD superfamily